jgi:hypothetical protein
MVSATNCVRFPNYFKITLYYYFKLFRKQKW